MVEVIWTEKFEQDFKKIDFSMKIKVKKQIEKIIKNPEVGKPLRYGLKGERTVYDKPYRVIYSFKNNTIYLLRYEHRKHVYD